MVSQKQPELPLFSRIPATNTTQFGDLLSLFKSAGKPGSESDCRDQSYLDHQDHTVRLPICTNEYWTSRQRAAHRLHEISYRACFKPQLPRFFIERLTSPGDVVYDPFMGRGTTLIESALLNRIPYGCDVNPLSQVLTAPRLDPPFQDDATESLRQMDWTQIEGFNEEFLVFYHPKTLQQICALRNYLLTNQQHRALSREEDWNRLITLNRLTGHSSGFLSVYTMPPNQAVSLKSQRRINERRNQTPTFRDLIPIVMKKSHRLLNWCDATTRQSLRGARSRSLILTGAADRTPAIPTDSVALIVTSPPFLSVVDYAQDNWLRCWFLGVDPDSVKLSVYSKLENWKLAMTEIFRELHRVLKPGGHIAFEVGEVNAGKIKLEEAVVPCGTAAGLQPILILINQQTFTKTAQCWGVRNNRKGTNTNRIVLFQKSSNPV